MSESLNIVENLNLNISVEDSSLPVATECELYSFAHGALIETLDKSLAEVNVDGDVTLDSLTIDLNVDAQGDVFRQIADALRDALKSKLGLAVFKAQSKPVTTMLADVYRQHMPIDKSSVLEHRFDALAESWEAEHQGQKFNPLAFSESVIKKMQAENPQMDIQQIAYVVYQRILQMKNAKTARTPDKNPRNSEQDLAKTAYEIMDSGLVLLAPYLPALFERMGCIEKGVFVNEESQRKALAVLKYAAYGNYAEPPKDAALMNLICNLPVSPVLYADELPKVSDSEKELIDSLLNAVIANWKAVGHMSPDGLRGTYFVRNGTLETAGASDMLTVETKTFDILLDKLPWGYSMIKHSWMKKVLNVKWR
ncbi:contractile injection system tape measure protein [Fibrobacter sp.]|uniref:contractile injection system tape measure protein n=1 Tax=Fibrobacter sp. TaxID=35828 RepID=UPI00386ED930